MPTFVKLRPEYDRLWRDLALNVDKLGAVDATARKILNGRARYERVADATGVPWYVIAIIHQMECSLSFAKHLHNGDPLTGRTFQVPKGRPIAGDPPFAWEVSAIDAIRYDGLDRVRDWSIERIAYELEGYNGWGYRPRRINSPYLWSYTNHYTGGKYVRDGVWSSTAVSKQSGAMAILKRLMDLDESIRPIDLPSGGDVHQMTPAAIVSIQEALNRMNYHCGAEDGRMGTLTEGAILAFEKDRKLPLSGEPSNALIEALERAEAAGWTRSLSPDRKNATVDDLKGKSRTVDGALTGQVVGGVIAVGGAVKGAADALGADGTAFQNAAENIGQVSTIARGLVDVLATIIPYWPWAAAALGLYTVWRMRKVIAAKLDDYTSGKAK